MKRQLKLITNILLTSIGLSVLLGTFLQISGPINQSNKINKVIRTVGKSKDPLRKNY